MARKRGNYSVRKKGHAITGVSKPSKGGSDVLWVVVLGFCILGMGGLAAFAFMQHSAKGKIDETTLCHEDGAGTRLAILLDLTDPLSQTQANQLDSMLDIIVDDAPIGAAVGVGVVSADPGRWGAQFFRCKPASGADANELYENPLLIGERFATEFEQPLNDTIVAMMGAGSENASPIMESMQALLSEMPPAKQTHVVIVSDLLQHSDTLSFYRGEGWEAFEAKGGPDRLARSLSGADLTLIRVPRPGVGAAVGAAADPFWARYFDLQGVKVPFDVVPLGDL